LAKVNRIRHYKGEILTNAKYHITLGHQTVMGTSIFFYSIPEESKLESDDTTEEYKFGIFGETSESVRKEVEFVYNTMHRYSDKLPRKATKPGPPPKDDILPMHA